MKPPSGLHELKVVGGGIGCGCTCRHPAAITIAATATVSNTIRNISTTLLAAPATGQAGGGLFPIYSSQCRDARHIHVRFEQIGDPIEGRAKIGVRMTGPRMTGVTFIRLA